jgi:hypothetical protein
MNLKTKKTIAREFLYFLISCAIGIITFTATYISNTIKKNQIQNIEAKIFDKKNISDSLSKQFKNKIDNQSWFYVEFNNKVSNHYKSYEKLWKRLENLSLNDSVEYKWNNHWEKSLINFNNEMGFKNPKEFNNFIIKNSLTKNEKYIKDLSTKIELEIMTLYKSKKQIINKIHPPEIQSEYGKLAIIISLIILFGLRYLYYSVKWSLKILKVKTE